VARGRTRCEVGEKDDSDSDKDVGARRGMGAGAQRRQGDGETARPGDEGARLPDLRFAGADSFPIITTVEQR